MELIIILALILINGIFSMSELAVISSRRFKLEKAAKKGVAGAKAALELSENPNKFLSTVQIGITFIGILLGIYSGENITSDVESFISDFGWFTPYEHTIATFIVLILITYFSIVLGELFPKRIGINFPEPIAIALAKPMYFISRIASPFVWVLTISNNVLLSIFGISKRKETLVTEDEIKSIIAESAEGGEIDTIEQEIVERVFELGDKKVNSIFTYKSDLVYFDIEDSWEVVKQKINEYKHLSYLVCENNDIDNIAGIILLKDLFGIDEATFSLKNFVQQPVYINELFSAYKLLEQFKQHKMHYGVVVDEFGSTKGMVTMTDLVDAIIGDVVIEDEESSGIKQRNENSWLVDGIFPLSDFQKYFNLELDEQILEKYATISGIFIYTNNEIPKVGDKITIDNYTIEVVDKDGQKVDKVMVTKL
ncbi:MAG: hypothetical protein RIR48_343 [Bacteroidota bacterium]